MKPLIILLGCLLILIAVPTGTAWADSMIGGGPCLSDSLSAYESLGSAGCTVGGVRFFSFSDSSTTTGGASAPPATAITVTPDFDAALSLTAPWMATGNETLETTIGFHASIAPNGDAVNSGENSFPSGPCTVGSLSLCVGGGGSGIVTETVCLGGIEYPPGPCGETLLTLETFNTPLGFLNMAGEAVSPIRALGVLLDISLNGSGGAASLGKVTLDFGQVPAPSTGLLLLAGLAALAVQSRRRWLG